MHKTILPRQRDPNSVRWAEEIAAERSERTADLIRARIGQR